MQTILIIEDNDVNIKLAETILSDAGYNVVSTTRAEETFALMDAHSPDLVLMDVHLPGMDGVTALQLLRSDPKRRATKVIAVTAMALPGDRDMLIGIGFDDYLSKPYKLNALLTTVRGALG